MLFCGRNESRYRTSSIASAPLSDTKWVTPEIPAWVRAPPNSSNVTSSPVTALITSGPVMNRWLVPSTWNTKSVMAGE